MVGLGQSLVRRNHTVVMAINAGMRQLAERAEFEIAEVGEVLGPSEARNAAIDWDHWNLVPGDEWRWTDAADSPLVKACQALIAASEGADFLIAPANDTAGWLAHEHTGIPWATVVLTPAMLQGRIPAQPLAHSHNETLSLHERSFVEHINRVRQRLGLPRRPPARLLRDSISARLLIASNASMAGEIGMSVPQASLTGFWLSNEPAWSTWKPDHALQTFVDITPRPLALSFSSLPLTNPRAVLAVHARAASILGRRLVVLGGWAGFSRDQLPADVHPEDFFFVDALPHDWLFAHVDVAFLHGGIGSLARALRASCPVVVEPYGNDQFFNARQVLVLGVGVAMHPHRITPAGLARVLTEKVLTSACRDRVAHIGREIAGDNGLVRATDRICDWLAEAAARDRSAGPSNTALL
jgi:UDP:flavonoid glycosyltransferase YjiC (YdhE family)